MSATVDRNSLAFWYPLLEAAGVHAPATRIVRTDAELLRLLDGEPVDGFDELIAGLRAAGDELGWPAFLRTGHLSGKHEWDRCCFVPSADALESHVAALVEHSALAGLMGLPTDVWAVRQMIDTQPLFRCVAYGGFPVTREFRFFVRDGDVTHFQPYWPPDAVEQGSPDDPRWRAKLAAASYLSKTRLRILSGMARAAVEAVGGGYWSVDLLQDWRGRWWVTDMADGDESFRWAP